MAKSSGRRRVLVPDFSLTRFLVMLSFSPKLQTEFSINRVATMTDWGLDGDEQKAIIENDVTKLRELFNTQSGDLARRQKGAISSGGGRKGKSKAKTSRKKR